MSNPKSADNISIRKIETDDIDAVFNLAEESRLSFWSAQDYRQEIVRTDAVCLLAQSECGEFCGFLVARLIMQEYSTELNNTAVSPRFLRRGVGSSLLNELVKISNNNNLDKILLEVRSSNQNAIRFYRQFGFEQIGLRKNFYSQPIEDALTMLLKLS